MKSSDYWGIGFNRTKKLESKPKSFAIFTTISDEGVNFFVFNSKERLHRCWKCILQPSDDWPRFFGRDEVSAGLRCTSLEPECQISVVLIFFFAAHGRIACVHSYSDSFYILHSPNNVFRPKTMCF